jgi:hypothetical protein
MFMAQVVATTFSCFIQVAVLNFALTNIKDICTPHQEQHFTCPGGRVFFSGRSRNNSQMNYSLLMISSFRNLGSHRPPTYLLPRSSLLWPLLVLWHRCRRPCIVLLRCPPFPRFTPQIPHGTLDFRRRSLNPSSHTAQLSLLGYHRFHLPEAH